MPRSAPLWGRVKVNGTFADLGPRVAGTAVAGRPAPPAACRARRLSMGGNRVRNSLTGIAAAVAVTGLLAGLGTAAGTRSAAAATRSAAAGTRSAVSATHMAGAVAAAGVPEGSASPVISATTKLSLRRYVAAGTGAYVVGAENGTFPPIGWHITGQMGGVWAPPTKLLDGLWFSVGSHWLADAVKYTTGPGFVRLSFPVTGGLRPTLTEFAPDGQ